MKAWNEVQDQEQTNQPKNVPKIMDNPPTQKSPRHKPWVENVTDEDALKASATAAANQKPSSLKLTPMLDTLIDQVVNAVKGHQWLNIHQQRQSSAIQPMSQITPESYLGQAMSHIKENEESPLDPSDSSYSFSSSSPYSSGLESGNGNERLWKPD